MKKNISCWVFVQASEDMKSLELNDPDSLDDLDPLALELFFSFDPLLSCSQIDGLWSRVLAAK